jgi:hypothetical protein
MQVLGLFVAICALLGISLLVGTLLRRLVPSLSVLERSTAAIYCAMLSAGGITFVASRSGSISLVGPAFVIAAVASGFWVAYRRSTGSHELSQWIHDPACRRAWQIQALGLASLTAAVSSSRTFTVFGWRGDWEEHWQRTVWIANQGALDMRFVGGYSVPSRPPLTNALIAGLTSVGGLSWISYMLAMAAVSSLAILPLLAYVGDTIRRVRFTHLLLLTIACPVFAVHTLFPWTKLSTAGFVIVAWTLQRKLHGSSGNLGFVVGAMWGAAVVSHYSGAVFALMAGLHFLVTSQVSGETGVTSLVKRFRNVSIFGLGGVLITGPWFVWSVTQYGSATWSDTSTVSTATGNPVLRTLINTVMQFAAGTLPRPTLSLLSIRDLGFAFLAVNVVGSSGAAAFVVSLRSLSRSNFKWIATLVVLATATLPEPIAGGAHAVLVPLAIAIAAQLIAKFPELSYRARKIALAACWTQWLFLIGVHGWLLMNPDRTANKYLAFDATRQTALGAKLIGASLPAPARFALWAISLLVPFIVFTAWSIRSRTEHFGSTSASNLSGHDPGDDPASGSLHDRGGIVGSTH